HAFAKTGLPTENAAPARGKEGAPRERRPGQLLAEMKQNGERQGQSQPVKLTSNGATLKPKVSDLGITRDQVMFISPPWPVSTPAPGAAPRRSAGRSSSRQPRRALLHISSGQHRWRATPQCCTTYALRRSPAALLGQRQTWRRGKPGRKRFPGQQTCGTNGRPPQSPAAPLGQSHTWRRGGPGRQRPPS